jgi:hypothetical protein
MSESDARSQRAVCYILRGGRVVTIRKPTVTRRQSQRAKPRTAGVRSESSAGDRKEAIVRDIDKLIVRYRRALREMD